VSLHLYIPCNDCLLTYADGLRMTSPTISLFKDQMGIAGSNLSYLSCRSTILFHCLHAKLFILPAQCDPIIVTPTDSARRTAHLTTTASITTSARSTCAPFHPIVSHKASQINSFTCLYGPSSHRTADSKADRSWSPSASVYPPLRAYSPDPRDHCCSSAASGPTTRYPCHERCTTNPSRSFGSRFLSSNWSRDNGRSDAN
jgi:hypothetical protein